MSFKILYHEQSDTSFNLASIAVYVDSFAKNLGIETLNVNEAAFNEVVAGLVRPDFPHKDGLDKASPFKKAANFFCWFVASRPILDPLPDELITPQLKSISNHQNVIFAYNMAVDCLHNSELHKGDTVYILKNKIKVSQHFFQDFVEAYSTATPVNDFKSVSLLFEQLAYKNNPGISYPEII